MKLFIINTNKQAHERYESEMIYEQKCAACRSTKEEIERIHKGDKVLLYSNGSGIIAKGVADGKVQKKEDNGVVDDEYFMELTEFYQYIKNIPYKKINKILTHADPSFARPFNVTSLTFEFPASKIIWDEVNKYV